GSWNALSGSPAVVLEISAPAEGPVAAATGRLPNLWDSARQVRGKRLDQSLIAMNDLLRIAVRRTPPGKFSVEDKTLAEDSALLFGLVLQGRLSVKWPGAPVPLYLLKGDLYKLTLLSQPVWPEFSAGLTYENPGTEEAIELQIRTVLPVSEARYRGVPPTSDKLVRGQR
ncbi:MAG: hypothetical protein COV48_16110, partial [Elusimicrobia bacterium CG11_big_fil_rev_8_21_14_0_20_64_6]